MLQELWVGTGTADATGKYSITLDKAYLNGKSLNAIAADKVGNTTTPKTIIAPDTGTFKFNCND